MDKRTIRRLPLNSNDIINRYDSGESPRSIATNVGCSAKAIIDLLSRHGVYRGRENWQDRLFRVTGYTPEKLLNLYNSGMWKSQIANHIGISEGTVGTYLSKMGVYKASSRSEAGKAVHERGGIQRRKAITKKAHEAIKGTIKSNSDLVKRAKSKEASPRFGSIMEKVLFDMLVERGLSPIPQKAVSKYNIDIAVGRIAVEITGRRREPEHIPALKERTKELFDMGYIVVWIWANTSFPITSAVADYIVSLFQESCVDPSLICENRVLRSDGKLLARSGLDRDNFTGVFTPIEGTYSRA